VWLYINLNSFTQSHEAYGLQFINRDRQASFLLSLYWFLWQILCVFAIWLAFKLCQSLN